MSPGSVYGHSRFSTTAGHPAEIAAVIAAVLEGPHVEVLHDAPWLVVGAVGCGISQFIGFFRTPRRDGFVVDTDLIADLPV
jgi:hypothetical protein